ncbi:hypothetical protein BHE90_016778 [Fusarium euwallaceae]|uniref:Homeobox domain-containing protein n=1 Tax=Fusarium euwallaceae TaxID=1147111 RepID=A0A430KZE6_9HYPO|nr:hypothetical protein BHE90_016778 [Fusarium euwallaceae]
MAMYSNYDGSAEPMPDLGPEELTLLDIPPPDLNPPGPSFQLSRSDICESHTWGIWNAQPPPDNPGSLTPAFERAWKHAVPGPSWDPTSPGETRDPGPQTKPSHGPRFSRDGVRILRNWMAAHRYHPYASPQDLDTLQRQTGLSRQQVKDWLANSRRRTKFQPYPMLGRGQVLAAEGLDGPMPSLRVQSRPPTPAPPELMNPLERWENSPPEHEPATVLDIFRALAASPRPMDPSGENSGHASSLSNSMAASNSSREMGSQSSAFSQTSGGSLVPGSSKRSSTQRRRRRLLTRRQEENWLRLSQACYTYQCTFCTETFKKKYDWQRHEKTQHLSVEEWICSPKGPMETHPEQGKMCVYCGEADPSPSHLSGHNHAACLGQPSEKRTFYRKDHLRQHLRLVHGSSFKSWPMEQWMAGNQEVRSRCGFCDKALESWIERVDHLAAHFKTGVTMADWKGDWGFEPRIVDMVENAMPPYLIHDEAKAPLPFSVSQGPADTPSSAFELVKLELAYYSRHLADTYGRNPSDEEMQYEACCIVFGADVTSCQPTSSAPSTLRDILLSSTTITERARSRPLKQNTSLRMSQLKVKGKNNIFDGCEFELQMCHYVGAYITLGHRLVDSQIQQEACNVLNRMEISSPNPSIQFRDFLERLIWSSTKWMAPLRERGYRYSLECTGGNIRDESYPDRRHYDRMLMNNGEQDQFELSLGQLGGILPSASMPDVHPALRTATSLREVAGDTFSIPDPSTQQSITRALSLSELGHLTTSLASYHKEFDMTPSTTETRASTAGPWTRTAGAPPAQVKPSLRGLEPGKGNSIFLNDNNTYRNLTRELSRFVASTMSKHNPDSHVPTDEELKHRARWILFDG